MTLPGLDTRNGLRCALLFALWLLVATGLCQQSLSQSELPPGWFLAGSNPTNYRAGVDRVELHDGLPSTYLASLAKGSGFGTMMKSISAANYAGKRVCFRGSVKSLDVDDWAGLWMRVDTGRQTMTFDNMQDRGIKSTAPWRPYVVVLDVPDDATTISFGILLSGAGEVWLKDWHFEVVNANTPATGGNWLLPSRF